MTIAKIWYICGTIEKYVANTALAFVYHLLERDLVAELHRNKYVVFNREEFKELLNEDLLKTFTEYEIPDAIVIRRQDYFASPCLLTYASMIAMVAEHHPDEKVKAELEIIADYFHEQGVLAGEEGFKLPTP